ncbi:MAG: aminotransferase class I/II-fold pyridoxal phosphate-dependent enzyme, partial [Chlorobi bacterium]|nr:aminotransferase class I/II-fold pyridoxal phosphate-dependent enzyme [Chlorobiota bacterium]
QSKLPNTGTSIFAVMTQLAREYKAVNLSQGFPDFPVSPELIELVHKYMKNGYNQYALMPGVTELRQAISRMFRENYGAHYDPDTEINIVAGATQGLFNAISTFVNRGDEVIIFEPAYDSYAPAVEANGGVVKYVELHFPDFRIDWEKVKAAINAKTRMIVVNSPHNPTGSILYEDDLIQLEKLTRGTGIIVLSDEVYEHIIFEGKKHRSVCRFPELASRSLLVGSFGKTFHATGWKTGFVLAPENLMKEFRKIHQFMVFAVNTPMQHAIAEYLSDSKHYTNLGSFFQEKRDFFLSGLKNSRFKILPSYGTYFQLLDYSNISDEPEVEFATRLIKEHGIAGVPVSSFYHNAKDNKTIRFCFAKERSTLEKAIEILCRI